MSTAPGRRPARQPAGRQASAAVIGVLTLLLGFAIAVQVHANSSADALGQLRDDELIGILDDQNARADRLRRQIAQLQTDLAQLRDSGNRTAAARAQVAQQAQALGILLGTLPATGPGVLVTVNDPAGRLGGEDLLDVVEELRGAGAEAIQVGDQRLGATSAFTGTGRAIALDGRRLIAPYRLVAIGDPKTLDTALNIPGGIAAVVRSAGGALTVTERLDVAISVTRPLPRDRYARPSG